jgi:SOS-response transcriptional repressor LexA
VAKRREMTVDEQDDAARLTAICKTWQREMKAGGGALTLDDIGADLGWGSGAPVSHYMNGHMTLQMEAVTRFARYFDVTVRDISPRIADMLPRSIIDTPGSPRDAVRDNANTVPVLSLGEVARLAERSAPVNGASGERVLCSIAHRGHMFGVRVVGESMRNLAGSPSFAEGDLLFVDTVRQSKSGSLVLVNMGAGSSDAVFRQLVEDSGQRYLKALNSAWPRSIIELPDDAWVVGVVRGKLEVFE